MTGASRSDSWHLDDESLRRWVDGVAGQLSGVSVEQHVVRCADCRAAVAALVPEQPLQLVWAKVLADVEVPRAGLAQRLLHRLGVNTSDSLVIASAGALRIGLAAWGHRGVVLRGARCLFRPIWRDWPVRVGGTVGSGGRCRRSLRSLGGSLS